MNARDVKSGAPPAAPIELARIFAGPRGESELLERAIEPLRSAFGLDSLALRLHGEAGRPSLEFGEAAEDAEGACSRPVLWEEREIGSVHARRAPPAPAPDAAAEEIAALLATAIGRIRRGDRLASRGLAAEQALRASRHAGEMKDRFISAVSHEFRTPLTSIRSFAEILLTHSAEDEETTREFVSNIHEESIPLTRLVNNLLDLGKMQAGRMEWDLSENRLATALKRATKAVTSLAAEKDVRVEVPDGPEIPPFRFDLDKIIQVLVNLLSNAMKHSRPGGAVTILTEPIESGARVTVRDRGPGIRPEDRERIFRRFWQAGRGRDRPTGTGLGLSISREIVEAHDGEIRVEEAPGGGSDFVFEIRSPAGGEPVLKPSRPETLLTETPAPPSDPPGACVLVIDDDPAFRRSVVYELTRCGYVVREAEEAVAGIESAREEKPDLVILDLSMPGLDGRDFLAVLRSDPATADIPVLVISALPEEESRAIRGVDRAIRKPMERADLLRLVRELLREKVPG